MLITCDGMQTMTNTINGDPEVMRNLLEGKSVLIVDDDEDYAEALDEVFSLEGCRVTRMGDPISAMKCALSNDFDLLIVDKNMPKLDGLEFSRRIHSQKPTSKIIMITAHPDESSRDKSREVGVRYYLSKPFRKNDLLEAASFVLL